uniref:Prenyltransferase-like n=1 Tax=Candidatus Kentrum sp. TUN TaxID=2126343 RepID=A0A450ZBM7_9GAMM|nr:MAG: Prenyltransferase-like [Candidatus Kentron sp. TUN]VFK57469.1 MAG: Prenyltransferase-like [Candidatus Kentron sp. TUN]
MKHSTLVKVSGKYLLIGLLGLPSIAAGTVHEEALESAVDWLVDQQNSDGSWSGGGDIRTLYTSESVLALSAVGIRDAAFYQGITWLSNHATTNVDFRARRITALDRHGDSLAGEFSRLQVAQQRISNWGWGLTHGYGESVLDTSLALLAHSDADPNEIGEGVDIQAALDYLAMQTLPDDPVVVAYLLRAVLPYQATHTVPATLVDAASTYLQTRVGATDTPLIRALAAFALSRADRYPNKVTALLDQLVTLQETTGDGKGSWEGDEYVTSVAIRAFSTVLGMDGLELAENVSIPDPILRRYINRALGRNSADSLSRSDLLRLTGLIAPDAGITDLTGLEAAENLGIVDLSGNRIADLSPLSGLENLTAAMDDSAGTEEDLAVSIAVLSNDIHVEGTGLTVVHVTQPTNGAASFTPASVFYTPSADYNGTDNFTYTATDGNASVTATVTVTVSSINDAPVAMLDSARVPDGGAITIDVLANDGDVDGDLLRIQGVIAPDNGTAVMERDGQITYTPNPDFTGTDTFDYTVSDGVLTASAVVTVTVIPETPYVYHILNPRFGDDAAFVVSLADNNIINAGNTTIALDRDEQGVIPMADLVQGTLVTGTGPFDIGGAVDATDVPLSVSLVGRKFVVPQVHGNHWYYLLSPDGQASATIDTGDAVATHTLPAGQVVPMNAGSNNTVSAVITSDVPILVAHVGTDGAGSAIGALMVPPAPGCGEYTAVGRRIWGQRRISPP